MSAFNLDVNARAVRELEHYERKFRRHCGEPVVTLARLHQLAIQKRSVVTRHNGRMPAAVVINWSGHTLVRAFKNGMYVYRTNSEIKAGTTRDPKLLTTTKRKG